MEEGCGADDKHAPGARRVLGFSISEAYNRHLAPESGLAMDLRRRVILSEGSQLPGTKERLSLYMSLSGMNTLGSAFLGLVSKSWN